jgi:glucoamylase
MTRFRGDKDAFGSPGIPPKWTRGAKDGIGTSYSADSKIWYTLWRGTLTEIYYPTVDTPQTRDMEYLISDGQTFFHEEKRHLNSEIERLQHHDLGYRITNSDPQGRYRIRKEVISDPHLPTVLQHTRLEISNDLLDNFHLYALCAPHLDGGGANNNAYVVENSGRDLFVAEKDGTWLVMGASIPFKRLSCGYVGASDGWTDLNDNMVMDWEFDRALNGNVAVMGELDLGTKKMNTEFTLAISLGDSLHNAITTLYQSLGVEYSDHQMRFLEQWERPYSRLIELNRATGDNGDLCHTSFSTILAHEDKSYPGAMIASLSIPWGETKGDEDKGGYHLVWTRDMIYSATALLAAGNIETPLRALIYLSTSQQEDGSFAQNFWVDGLKYWGGVQLDEVALPIILAWRLQKANALQAFDPYEMVVRAARFLLMNGPATAQDRWEEAGGYSPSTLATNIAALICASQFCRWRGDEKSGRFLEEHADFLESHLESWTCTKSGTLVPGITQHYVRINPVDVHDPTPNEDLNSAMLVLANQPPNSRYAYPAKEIVDGGFLELVRYGIRSPSDKLIVDSLKVIDAVLKIDTPFGPCWHRYNHDGYGERENGEPFQGWGVGRAWPLLTAERGLYELAAGNGVKSYIETMEKLSSATGLLPEQVWDSADIPEAHLHLGRPTGSVMPLCWAHAEYLKLIRSASEGKVFDLIPEIEDRYIKKCAVKSLTKTIEVWKHNRQPRSINSGTLLRIQASQEFVLHFSFDDWKTVNDADSMSTNLGVDFVDMVSPEERTSIKFTFYWPRSNSWEGKDYFVNILEYS